MNIKPVNALETTMLEDLQAKRAVKADELAEIDAAITELEENPKVASVLQKLVKCGMLRNKL